MDDSTKQKLDDINKLIFVKSYSEAYDLLDEAIAISKSAMTIFHFRRIELAEKLGRISVLKEQYKERFDNKLIANGLFEQCNILLDQYDRKISAKDVIKKFLDILVNYPEDPLSSYALAQSYEVLGALEKALYHYERCIFLDPDWAPAYFGLSQIYYAKNQDEKGDEYFFVFEKKAPYNLYGNYTTHKRIYDDFFQQNQFDLAFKAIESLGTWWKENKGHIPFEVQIVILLSKEAIYEKQNDKNSQQDILSRINFLLKENLKSNSTPVEQQYYLAKVFDEFKKKEISASIYENIALNTNDLQLIQNITSELIGSNQYGLALSILDSAFEKNPDNSEIQFLRLATKLKMKKIPVDEYIYNRERLKNLFLNQSTKVEVLSLAHNLLSQFDEDCLVYGILGDFHKQLGNIPKALANYDQMIRFDSSSSESLFKYIEFMLEIKEYKKAEQYLEKLKLRKTLNQEQNLFLMSLQASYYNNLEDFQKAIAILNLLLKSDPWNIKYIQEIILSLVSMKAKDKREDIDTILYVIKDETKPNWSLLDQICEEFKSRYEYQLAYLLQKIKFLFLHKEKKVVKDFLDISEIYDNLKVRSELLFLINTNYDNPYIYYMLGKLSFNLWQLEVAQMWFDHVKDDDKLNNDLKGEIFLGISQCLIWRALELPKAIAFLYSAFDLNSKLRFEILLSLAHAQLKNGNIKESKQTLLQIPPEFKNFEFYYIEGLIEHRNGQINKAKEIWKPFLTHKTVTQKEHKIKQDILRYYFDGEVYSLAG